jgi:hypothetical protein
MGLPPTQVDEDASGQAFSLRRDFSPTGRYHTKRLKRSGHQSFHRPVNKAALLSPVGYEDIELVWRLGLMAGSEHDAGAVG